MGMLNSIGLSPVKRAGTVTSRALRRIFGRRLPADEEDVTAGASSVETDTSNSDSHSHSHSESPQPPASSQENKDTLPHAAADAQSSPSKLGSSTKLDSQLDQLGSNTAASSGATASMAASQVQPLPGKEHQALTPAELAKGISRLGICDDAPSLETRPVMPAMPAMPAMPIFDDPVVIAERAKHMEFMGEALDMACLALRTNETPVGCVLVHDGKVIARGMNATNVTRNGTRHAEFMAISALLSYPSKNGPRTTRLKPLTRANTSAEDSDGSATDDLQVPNEENENGSKGHLYPYGQKLHPDLEVDRAIIRESILYVTVEPCVMCASLLRQFGVKKVYFGAVNDKFGGTGGVFSIHANSLPVTEGGESASSHPMPKPTQLPDGSGILGTSFPPRGGDGGNIERGYEVEGGWGRDDAVALLRRFYVQENGRAPMPRKKEGRAARLAAMMERDEDPSALLVTPPVEDDTETLEKVTGDDNEKPEVEVD